MGKYMLIRIFLSLTIAVVSMGLFTANSWGNSPIKSVSLQPIAKNINKLKLYPMKQYKVRQSAKQKNMASALAKARGLNYPLKLPIKVVDPYKQKQEGSSMRLSPCLLS